MWCDVCKAEYNDDAGACPLCGQTVSQNADAVKAVWGRSVSVKGNENWPSSPNGSHQAPAFLVHCSCLDMDDEIVLNMLSAYGIPAIRQYPKDGGFGKVVLGMSGSGADIYVPESMLSDALALMGGISDD